jgi:hypothetical protein
MYVVSLLMYVKVAHLGFSVGGGFVWLCSCEWLFVGLIGNELLCSMLWIMFSSCLYSSVCSW